MAQQVLELLFHVVTAIPKRQAQAGLTVKDHDGDAVLVSKYPQGLMSGGGNPLDMRPHTGAHVEQEQHVHRHVFASKVADFLPFAFVGENEILSAQAGDGSIVPIHYLHVYADQRNIAPEYHIAVAGRSRKKPFYRQRQQQDVSSAGHRGYAKTSFSISTYRHPCTFHSVWLRSGLTLSLTVISALPGYSGATTSGEAIIS
jgi:hypothetical protein